MILKYRKQLLPILIGAILGCENSQQNPWYIQSARMEVDKVPTRFEGGLISTDRIEYNTSLSTSRPEFYFSTAAPDFSFRRIMVSRYTNGVFSEPQSVAIGGEQFDASDVHITESGDYLFFKMRGQVPGYPDRKDGNIWKSKREGNVWGKAKMLPSVVNSSIESEYYPVTSTNGNLYFSRESKETSYDIFVSKYKDGQYQEAVRLPSHINTELLESDAYIAPDESYMIFVRMYAADGLGVSDLYITFNRNGSWSIPLNMKAYNSSGVDGSPFVTPDGQYLFFTSNRHSDNPKVFNGFLDIYVAKFDETEWRENM